MLPADSLPARIRAKINVPEDPDACWPWTACTSSAGYGRVGWNRVTRESHRVVYSLLVGPIPEGADLDHICHDPQVCTGKNRECPHRRCQNPAHMEPKTRGANVLRGSSPPSLNALKDRCDNGHLYTPETTVIDGGTRRCLICRRVTDKRRRRRYQPARNGRFRSQALAPEIRDREILRLRAEGLTYMAIAETLGISSGFTGARYRYLISVRDEAA